MFDVSVIRKQKPAGFQGRDLKSDMTSHSPPRACHKETSALFLLRVITRCGSLSREVVSLISVTAWNGSRRDHRGGKKGGMRKEEERLDGRNSCPVTLIVLAVSDREEINMSLTICTSIHPPLRHVYVLMFAAAIRAAPAPNTRSEMAPACCCCCCSRRNIPYFYTHVHSLRLLTKRHKVTPLRLSSL